MQKEIKPTKRRTQPFQIRIWKHINKDGPTPQHIPNLGPCWEWTGATVNWGYGMVKKDHPQIGQIYAHRASWITHFGKIPEGMLVCHKCDNPPCCNPEHLFLGTPSQNIQDSLAKGRFPVGEKHISKVKISEKDVEIIRNSFGVVTQRSLAKRFGICPAQINRIIHNKRWKHIT